MYSRRAECPGKPLRTPRTQSVRRVGTEFERGRDCGRWREAATQSAEFKNKMRTRLRRPCRPAGRRPLHGICHLSLLIAHLPSARQQEHKWIDVVAVDCAVAVDAGQDVVAVRIRCGVTAVEGSLRRRGRRWRKVRSKTLCQKKRQRAPRGGALPFMSR
jgi:hypothetical protein